MKSRLFALLAAALFAGSSLLAQPATPSDAPPPHPAVAEMGAVVGKIMEKMRAQTERTESAYASELAEFDALLKKYEGDKSEAVAQIAMMKASFYLEILNDDENGKKGLEAVVQNYPGTRVATAAERTLKSLTPEAKAAAAAKRAEEEAKLKALVGNAAPEINFTWTSEGGWKKLSDMKGKVVVLDFWATWCGPCIASFPQVREHVEHFEGTPVVFLGVTSVQGRVHGLPGGTVNVKDDVAKEYELTREFMKAKDMTWPVAFSEENVFNPDFVVRGIPYVAIIAPDGTVRHVGLHPGNAASDITGKVTKLLEEFKLATPKA